MKHFHYVEDGQPIYVSGESKAAAGVPESAIEVPRLPEAFERWESGAWVLDEVAKAADAEERRVRGLSRLELRREIKREARAEIIADLEAEGVVNAAVAARLRARLANR